MAAAPRAGTGASGMFGQNSGDNCNASSASSTSSATTADQYYIDHDNAANQPPTKGTRETLVLHMDVYGQDPPTHRKGYQGGRTPWQSLKGETPDMSALIEFDDYDFVNVRLPTGFPNDNWVLAQWVGPGNGIGQELTYYVIKANGQVVVRSMMRPLLPEEWTSDVEKRAKEEFDKQLTEHIGAFDKDHIQLIANDEMEEPIGLEADDDLADGKTNAARTTTNRPVNDVTVGPDSLVGAEICFPHGDRNGIARVMGRKRNSDGLYIGRAHRNPMLDSSVFTVESQTETSRTLDITSSQNTSSLKSTKRAINIVYLRRLSDIAKTHKQSTKRINTDQDGMENKQRNKRPRAGTSKLNVWTARLNLTRDLLMSKGLLR
jgi:hypothetical protein